MIDILRFEKDGRTYAKGFFNQNGPTFYVLPGFEDIFSKKVGELGTRVSFHMEVSKELPGETGCPAAP